MSPTNNLVVRLGWEAWRVSCLLSLVSCGGGGRGGAPPYTGVPPLPPSYLCLYLCLPLPCSLERDGVLLPYTGVALSWQERGFVRPALHRGGLVPFSCSTAACAQGSSLLCFIAHIGPPPNAFLSLEFHFSYLVARGIK